MSRIIVNIPEATSGNFEVRVENTDFVAGESEPLADYTFLYKDGDRIMQDTTKEYREHQPLWDGATGVIIKSELIKTILFKIESKPPVSTTKIGLLLFLYCESNS